MYVLTNNAKSLKYDTFKTATLWHAEKTEH